MMQKIFENELLFPIIILVATFICFALFLIFILVKNYYTRMSNNRRLYEVILQSQETERKRIGKELHDELGGSLTGIKLELHSLKDGETNTQKLEVINEISKHLSYVVKEIRSIANTLSPHNLTDNGWIYETNEYISLLQARSHITIEFQTPQTIQTYSLNSQLYLLRIMQELFTSAIQYSKAANVLVDVKEDANKLQIDYTDDGTGFDFTQQETTNGFKNIQSRIELLGGRISNSTSYKGTGYHIQFNIADLK